MQERNRPGTDGASAVTLSRRVRGLLGQASETKRLRSGRRGWCMSRCCGLVDRALVLHPRQGPRWRGVRRGRDRIAAAVEHRQRPRGSKACIDRLDALRHAKRDQLVPTRKATLARVPTVPRSRCARRLRWRRRRARRRIAGRRERSTHRGAVPLRRRGARPSPRRHRGSWRSCPARRWKLRVLGDDIQDAAPGYRVGVTQYW